ncbi:MAG: hypothetical protein VXZ72_05150 [Chlamydiota bacterium]|nr:hypothetical protein [Chlamydiota bacterium]
MGKEALLENFYMLKEAGHDLSRVERYALMVDEAATKALPRHHAHRVKLECHYDDPIPLNKKAALENFYMLKEAAKKSYTYDRDKLRTDTQKNVGRATGALLGSFAGGFGKSTGDVLVKGLGGMTLGAAAGNYLGPKVLKVNDDVLDFSVDQALKNKDPKVLKDLRNRYNLKKKRG